MHTHTHTHTYTHTHTHRLIDTYTPVQRPGPRAFTCAPVYVEEYNTYDHTKRDLRDLNFCQRDVHSYEEFVLTNLQANMMVPVKTHTCARTHTRV